MLEQRLEVRHLDEPLFTEVNDGSSRTLVHSDHWLNLSKQNNYYKWCCGNYFSAIAIDLKVDLTEDNLRYIMSRLQSQTNNIWDHDGVVLYSGSALSFQYKNKRYNVNLFSIDSQIDIGKYTEDLKDIIAGVSEPNDPDLNYEYQEVLF